MTNGAGPEGLRPLERGVWLENLAAVKRRWRIAQQLDRYDDRVLNRFFPGQRNLLECLSVLDEKEVDRVARCSVPLFAASIICSASDVAISRSDEEPKDPIERDNFHEVVTALSARLVAVHQSRQQAEVTYHLTRQQAAHLSQFAVQQLKWLALQPDAVLRPLAKIEYFMAAAFSTSWLDTHRATFALASRYQNTHLAA